MKPTQQQQYVVEKTITDKAVLVGACAGAGKTSTLELTALALKVKSLYVCFNKVTAVEASARFPSYVDCLTSHSIAYRVFGAIIQHKLSRPKGKYVNVAGTGSEVARFYRLDGCGETATANAIGLYVKQTVERFEQSAALVMDRTHVPQRDMVKVIEEDPTIIGYVLRAASKMWSDRINPDSVVLATHDTYLKQYQMSKPRLPYEVIYLDEAQDTTPCVLDIVLNQAGHAKLVFVGDRRQAIYQWRGATNAMTSMVGTRCDLSQSFRYGQGIAEVASACLHYDMKITGREDIKTTIGFNVVDKTKPYMYLFRTNSMLLIEAVDAIDKGEKVKVEIDVRDFVKILQSAEALFKGDLKNVKHERILPYPTWADMVEESQDGGELKRLVGIVESGRCKHIIDVLDNYVEPANFIATFTTAHKAKGREAEQVILADDFPTNYKKGQWVGLPESEENLLYVGLTRAIRVLEINTSLEEILDKYGIKFEDSRYDSQNTGTVVDMIIADTKKEPEGATKATILKGRGEAVAQFTDAAYDAEMTRLTATKQDDESDADKYRAIEEADVMCRNMHIYGTIDVPGYMHETTADMAVFANEGIEAEQRWVEERMAEGYSLVDIEDLPF